MTQQDLSHRDDPFMTTQWSVVMAAGEDATDVSREALAQLCERYWGPLYAYVRRRGHDAHDAQDVIQGFFAQFLERGCIKAASPGRGKFRAYLLTALKHYMANEHRRAQTQKRGGGQTVLSLDFGSAEGVCQIEPVQHDTPETLYEQRWALALLDGALQRLEREHAQNGKAALFGALSPCLTGEAGDTTYAQLAEQLGMSEGAVKVAVHRMRKRFGTLLRDEIAQTVANAAEIEEEIRHLFSLFH